MADIADVEAALVSLIASAIYPSGTGSASAITLASGSHPNCRVYAGWPLPGNLDADMAGASNQNLSSLGGGQFTLSSPGGPGSAPVIHITVFAQPGMERPVKAYPREWLDQSTTPSTITTTVAAQAVTLGGAITAGHYVTIVAGTQAFSYAAQAGDTLATVAAALVALMPAGLQASAVGPVITVAAASSLVARTGAPGVVIRELKRQQRRFTVTIWAPTNDARAAAARVVEPALAATDRLLLTSDNTLAHLVYAGENDIDRSGKQSVMCRDMSWIVEYATTQTMPGYPITTIQTSLATNDGTPAGATLVQSG